MKHLVIPLLVLAWLSGCDSRVTGPGLYYEARFDPNHIERIGQIVRQFAADSDLVVGDKSSGQLLANPQDGNRLFIAVYDGDTVIVLIATDELDGKMFLALYDYGRLFREELQELADDFRERLSIELVAAELEPIPTN